MNITKMFFACVVAVLIMTSACATGPKPSKFTALQKLDAPAWVVKGSGAFSDAQGKAFFGVALTSDSPDMSLMRLAADNRARNELAMVVQYYTASLMKDYRAKTRAGEGKGVTAAEELTEAAEKTVTIMTLSGVEIIDHWQNPETGDLYSLARLDLSAVKDAFEKTKELDARAREYVRKNAENLHDQLGREEEKLSGPKD